MKPFQRGRFADLPEKPRRAHSYFETPAQKVRVASNAFGDLGIHYREVGSGPPLLLVHGLMTTSYSWRYLMPELGRSFRVIAPDLPGCGRSDKPHAIYSATALSRFLVELVDALGIRGCAVVGNSMGGMLCMRAALLDAGAFCRVVDVHSPGPPAFRYAALHALLSLPPLRAILSAWVRRAPRKWAHKNVHYYDESLKSLEEAAEYGDPLATPDGAAAFIGHLRDVFAPSELRAFMRALEQPFPVPLLFVYSRQDPLVPPSIGELLHQKVPEAPLVWLEKTSHFAHVDTPEAVLQAILPFLSPPAAAAG